jgi:exopolyphosphatase/guanosine-5'-triphosphate,3'-diphosphate pyrophosphatase
VHGEDRHVLRVREDRLLAVRLVARGNDNLFDQRRPSRSFEDRPRPNSTRLLVADVDGRRVAELERDTTVTRLGERVDESGRLADDAIGRVLETCDRYAQALERLQPERKVAVLTSAVRDARNGSDFELTLRKRYGVDARTISGDEEARLTFLGATSARAHREPLLVVDIGGGSTEFVVGGGGEVAFHVSTRAGSVRHTERELRSDPPTDAELASARDAIRAEIAGGVPEHVRRSAADGVAVAGTPTSFAAIAQALDPYDRARVDGYRLSLAEARRILAALAKQPLDDRRAVTGLHPDRAPTIVAGGIILTETMSAFALDSVEVSEHDILEGAAIAAASPLACT